MATFRGRWEERPAYQSEVEEAKRRGLTCGTSAEERARRAETARRAEEEAALQAEARRKALQQPVLVGAGSGFAISKDGYVLTNQHVVEGCELVVVHPPSGLRKATVRATDNRNDLALLEVELDDETVIPLSVKNARLLDDVIVAGYPLSGSLSTTVKVTKGIVSSLAGTSNDYSQMQIDAAVQPGNSGGPILDVNGNAVGVTVAQLSKRVMLRDQGIIPENTNFGVKASTARVFVEANGVQMPQPSAQLMSRRDMADLITKTTHLVSCWVSRATASQMANAEHQKLDVSPTMLRRIEALQ